MIAAVSYETYKMFAQRYGIRITFGATRKLKSMHKLKKEIYSHENHHNVRDGLYF